MWSVPEIKGIVSQYLSKSRAAHFEKIKSLLRNIILIAVLLPRRADSNEAGSETTFFRVMIRRVTVLQSVRHFLGSGNYNVRKLCSALTMFFSDNMLHTIYHPEMEWMTKTLVFGVTNI